MNGKQRLELNWIGKYEKPRLEPRILIEDTEQSYHASEKADGDRFDNILVHGDNLLALKALEAEYRGQVKCVYVDPPYNTGNAFEHYDDGVEHSIWLSLIRDRLELLRSLLAPDGFLCCQIDDTEGAYLKVMLDEIFGRSNYLTSFYIQVRYGNKTLAEDSDFQKVIEQCFIYAKDANVGKPIKGSEEYKVEKFEWEIQERAPGKGVELGGKRVEIFKPGEYEVTKVVPHLKALKETWATGSLLKQKGSSGEFLGKYLAPRKSEDGLGCLYKVYGIGEDGIGHRYFTGPKKEKATKGKFYSGIPLDRLAELQRGQSKKEKPIENFYDLAANFGNCRLEGGADFRSGKKPERLLEIVLKHFSREGDLVLDSFAGSGTTGAVAHKMGRRWIMVELGDHAKTLIVPRLKSVIDGTDNTGVTDEIGWKGGGGFRFYRLAPSLLDKDKWGNWVISKDYNSAMLAEAMCKHMGFTYAPSQNIAEYWRHGHSSEHDFIFVTTASLTHDQLKAISLDVGSDRTLLICCKAFNARPEDFNNLTVKKIPHAVLSRCEWGRDDYSLEIASLPIVEREADAEGDAAPRNGTKATRKGNGDQPTLFGDGEG